MNDVASLIKHHPLVAAVKIRAMSRPRGFQTDFLGIRTRTAWIPGFTEAFDFSKQDAEAVWPPHPEFDEEYFEWTDMFEAVSEADSTFVMMELGAGFGRWLVRGATLARGFGKRFQGIGVEAEPEHFRWMKQHMLDNDVNPAEMDLTWAAVGAESGWVPFWVGDQASWYGQKVAQLPSTAMPSVADRRKLKARSALGRPPAVSKEGQHVVWVPSVALHDLIDPYERIDLIDLDVQGLELEILTSGIDDIDAKVRRVHVGTHSAELESGLRTLFTEHGWENLNDYPCGGAVATPYGDISFVDGVQTWRNPCVGPPSERRTLRRSVPTPAPGAVEAPMRSPTEEELRSRITTLRKKNAKLRANVEKLRSRYGQLKQKLRER